MKPLQRRRIDLPRSVHWALVVLCLACLGWHAAPRSAPGASVAVLTIDGAIGPATTDYLVRGIRDAEAAGDVAVVLRMDTPGGLDAATRDINQAILASRVPVIAYVAPEGARAASAGTYILYASHVAAMAPATSTGAATPVSIMPSGAAPAERGEPSAAEAPDEEAAADEGGDADRERTPPPGDAMSRKAINDSVAYIRGLADKRGRNADWAERAVRDAASVSANQALELGVIDLVAANVTELLEQADGRTVATAEGETTLATAGATAREVEPDLRTKILARITDPSIAYLLFLVGIYGLLLEGYNPGVFLPGIVGAICLTLALYAFQLLPINYAGVLLIGLGVALLVAEAFAPSFGVLGIGGLVSLTIGSLIVIDEDVAHMAISRGVIAAIGTLSGLAFLGLSIMVARSRRRPPAAGGELVVGREAEVMDERGRVHLLGEDWFTASDDPLTPGDRVEVLALEGLTLKVRRIHSKEETT